MVPEQHRNRRLCTTEANPLDHFIPEGKSETTEGREREAAPVRRSCSKNICAEPIIAV